MTLTNAVPSFSIQNGYPGKGGDDDDDNGDDDDDNGDDDDVS